MNDDESPPVTSVTVEEEKQLQQEQHEEGETFDINEQPITTTETAATKDSDAVDLRLKMQAMFGSLKDNDNTSPQPPLAPPAKDSSSSSSPLSTIPLPLPLPLPQQQQQQRRRRIFIVGAGVAGLTLALALKRLEQIQNGQVRYEVLLFEKNDTYTERGVHYILWRWVAELLLELGLAKRLSRVAWPVLNFRSLDADSKEVLVQWPPGSDAAAKQQQSSVASSLDEQGDQSLPPMLGLRQVDLLRLLMLGLSGARDDLLDSEEFVATGANNSDIACGGVIEDQAPSPTSPLRPHHLLESDLARGNNWFEKERWRVLLPQLRTGHEIDSYTISPVSGKVSVLFKNGHQEIDGDMLIGADGFKSRVRELLHERPYPPLHVGAAVFSGITRIHIPPVDSQTELEDGRFIEDMTRDDIYTFAPDGTAVSVMSNKNMGPGGLAFGVTNIGNGMLGWNLVVGQTEPSEHIEKIIMNNRKNAISAVLAHNPRSSLIINQNMLAMKSLATGEGGELNYPEISKMVGANGSIDGGIGGATGSGGLSRSSSTRSMVGGPPRSSSSRPTTPLSHFLDPVSSDQLSGTEIRTLALRLCMPLPLPHPSHAIMARADPELITVHDVYDLADEKFPLSFSSPNSHPGRIMLIGDAAHPVATNAHGSVGAGLAIGDAVLLAKLLGWHLDDIGGSSSSNISDIAGASFAPHDTADGQDPGEGDVQPSGGPLTESEKFRQICLDFDVARVELCGTVVKEARTEGPWNRADNVWSRLMRFGYGASGNSWAKASYGTMLSRGRIRHPLSFSRECE